MDRPIEQQDDTEDDDRGPPMPSREELRAMMDRSNADAVARRTVPLEPVLARLRAAANSIRQRRAEAAAETKVDRHK